MNAELIELLSKCLTQKRFDLLQKVLKNRTRYLTVVLEDIYQSQNASAVLRSCDCFGIQDIHIVENRNEFNVDREVAMGSSKWLSLHYYRDKENNTLEAINALKQKGYKIIATSPHSNDVNLEDFDLSQGKTALVFGTELTGISKTVEENADGFMKIPMYGFTESFNISVSAAITFHHLVNKLQHSDIDFKLKNDEQEAVLLEWMKRSIKGSELIVNDFITKTKS